MDGDDRAKVRDGLDRERQRISGSRSILCGLTDSLCEIVEVVQWIWTCFRFALDDVESGRVMWCMRADLSRLQEL